MLAQPPRKSSWRHRLDSEEEEEELTDARGRPWPLCRSKYRATVAGRWWRW